MAERTIVKKNIKRNVYHLYFYVISSSWLVFIMLFFAFFIAIHLFFAGLYVLDQDSITGAGYSVSLWEGFCFSVQSLSTIGYGVLSPNNWYGNLLVTFEAFWGILYTAILTGCFFAKISRPTDQIVFSQNILLYSDKETENQKILSLRLASALDGELIDARAEIFLRIWDVNRNVWHLTPLELSRAHSPSLNLNWVLFHQVDTSSPLFGITPEDMERQDIRFFVSVSAFDRIYQQPINEQHVYQAREILIEQEFEDMIIVQDEQIILDLEKIHNTK